MTNPQHSRRHFLKRSLAVAGAGSVIPYISLGENAFAKDSPCDRPIMGLIGTGSRCGQTGPDLAQYCDVAAVCDVDSGHLESAKNNPKFCKNKKKPEAYSDYRKLLERKDIDVVSIATVDHWHTKIAIEALQAGKHVYCEKPLTFTLEENQLIRNACKKYNKAFQIGTWQRGDKTRFLRAINMVQKGLLGEVKKVVVGITRNPLGGEYKKETPPKELNWDFWQGQTQKVDYIKERCHYTFRWWYEYSGGKFTDWGAHHVDIATWALGLDGEGIGPTEIDGTDVWHPLPMKDGYPTIDDCYNTPSDFAVKCKFPGGVEMIVDSRSENGVRFEGSKGRIFVSRGKISGKPIEENWDKDKYGPDDLKRLYKGKPYESHNENFFRSIREGGLAVSDPFSHIQALNTCHLCTIAARLQRVIRWDPKAEKILGDDQAAAFFVHTPRKGFEIPRV
jgi:predicted dehydrogenase